MKFNTDQKRINKLIAFIFAVLALIGSYPTIYLIFFASPSIELGGVLILIAQFFMGPVVFVTGFLAILYIKKIATFKVIIPKKVYVFLTLLSIFITVELLLVGFVGIFYGHIRESIARSEYMRINPNINIISSSFTEDDELVLNIGINNNTSTPIEFDLMEFGAYLNTPKGTDSFGAKNNHKSDSFSVKTIYPGANTITLRFPLQFEYWKEFPTIDEIVNGSIEVKYSYNLGIKYLPYELTRTTQILDGDAVELLKKRVILLSRAREPLNGTSLESYE